MHNLKMIAKLVTFLLEPLTLSHDMKFNDVKYILGISKFKMTFVVVGFLFVFVLRLVQILSVSTISYDPT